MKSKFLRKMGVLRPLSLLVCLLASMNVVLADGTREMYAGIDGGKSRAGILAGEYKRTPAGMPFKNFATMKVYAETGEHIYLASSIFLRDKANMGTTKITWKAPDGSKGEFTKDQTNGYTVGCIENRAAEVGGPSLAHGAAGGYTPFNLTVGEGQTGVWKIEFVIVPNNPRNANDEGTWSFMNTVNEFYEIGWVEDGADVGGSFQQGNMLAKYPYMMAFDISVANAGETALIPGRTYTNVMSVMLPVRNGDWNYPWDAKFYVLTNEGYLYDVRTGGINPGTGTLFANNRGIVMNGTNEPMGENISGYVDAVNRFYTVGGESSYKSVEFYNNSQIIPTYNPNMPDNYTTNSEGKRTYIDVTHKMFFSKPSKDLPEMALAVYGNTTDSTWLLSNSAHDNPELSNLQFVGKENGVPNVFGPEGVDIQFEANSVFEYELLMTFPGTSYKERKFKGTSHKGVNIVEWDGLDGNGLKVPNVQVAVSGSIKTAEIHFPWFDLEYNPNGFQLNLLKSDWTTVKDGTMYWDDSQISGSQNLDGHLTGHTFNQGFGDNRILDTWTYASANVANTIIDKAARQFIDLEVVSIEADKTEISDLNDDITFTMKVRNNYHESYTFKGDNVEVNANALGASIGIPGFDIVDISSSDPLCTIVSLPTADTKGLGYINLANNHEATITVKGKVSSASISGHSITAGGYIMRPGDIYEIDANNIDTDGKPLDPEKEYEGKSHNNFKTIEINFKNAAPTAVADVESVVGGQTLSKNVLTNDSDIEGDGISVVEFTVNGVTSPAGSTVTVKSADGTKTVGTLTVNADGSYTFVAENVAGNIPTITYKVTDDYALDPATSTSTLDIEIIPNTAPTIAPTTVEIYNGTNAKLPVEIIDPENDDLTVTLSGTDAELFNVIGSNIYYKGGTTILSDTEYEFVATAEDGINTTTETIKVTVKAKENQPPYAKPLEATIIVLNNSNVPVYVPVGFFDPDGDGVTVTLSGADASHFKIEDGCLYYIGTSPAYGSQVYDNLTATVSDGEKTSIENIKVTVNVEWNQDGSTKNLEAQDITYGTMVGANFGNIVTTASAVQYGSPVNGSWSFTAVNKTTGVSYSYDYDASGDKGVAEERILPVGDYTLIGHFTPTAANVPVDKKTADFKVGPRSITITSGSETFTQDGNAHSYPVATVTEGSLVGDDQLTYYDWATITSGADVANTFKVVANKTSQNYDITLAYGTLSINALSSIEVTPQNAVYDGNVQHPEPTVKDGSTVLTKDVDYTVSYITTDSKDAGSYQVVVTPIGSYSAIEPITKNYTITQAPITVNGGKVEKVYDGGNSIASATTTITAADIDGVKSTDNVEVTIKSGEYENVNAEIAGNKVDITAYELSGTDAKNYYISDASINQMDGFISKKPITLAWAEDSYEYDGTEKSVTATPSGVISTEDASAVVTINYVDDSETSHTATNAGNYTAKATVTSANYELKASEPTATFDWEITKKVITITEVTASKVYDKTTDFSVVEATISGDVPGEDVSVNVTGGNYVSANAGNNIGLENLTYELTGADKGNYQLDATPDPTINASISQKEVSLSWNYTEPFIYDGSQKIVTATVTNTEAGDDVTVTTHTGNSASEVGNYKAVAQAIDNANYKLPTDELDRSLNWEITAAPSATANTPSVSYNGENQQPTFEVKVGETVIDPSKYTVTYPSSSKNADTYEVTITAKDPSDFLSFTANFTIDPAVITINGATVAPKDYDGDADATVTVDPETNTTGIIAADLSKITIIAVDPSFDNKNAGTNKSVTVDSYTLSGEAAGNYTLSPSTPSLKGSISPIELTPSATVANKVYNGLTDATITAGTPAGIVSGDKVTLTATGSFADKDVEDNKAITVNYELIGDDKDNYTLSASSSTEHANITPKEVTLTWSETTFTYDGTTRVVTATVGGTANSEEVTVTSYSNNEKSAVNNYTAVANTLSDENYKLPTNASVDWKIVAATGTITVEPIAAETYNGEAHTPAPVVTMGGKTLVEGTDYTVTYTNNTNAGTATATITPKEGSNYSFTATPATFTINKATISATVEVSNKPYDGETDAEVTIKTTTGKIGTEDVAITATGSFDTKNAGEDKDVIVTYTLTGTAKDNYELTSTTSTEKASISPKVVTLNWGEISFIYDGDEKTVAATVEGAVGSDVVNVSGYTGNKATQVNNYTATATGLDNDNYQLPADPSTGWSIASSAITVSVEIPSATRTYNGEEHKPVPTVKIDDVVLTEGTDYVVVYSNNVNAGEATISVKPAPGSGYVFSQVNEPFTITPATITVTEATVTPKVYDSNANAEVTVNTISGNVNTDDVTVTATGTFDNKNVGDDKDVTVTYTLSGADKGNYTLAATTETKTGDITPKTITVAKSTAEDKVYDATDDATVSIAESDVTGKIGDEDVTVSATGTFDNANVGDDKNVDVTYTLSGADKANYRLASSTGSSSANITPKEVSLAWGTSEFTYDGTEKTITATVEGAEGDDVVAVTTYTDNAKTEVGEYKATATELSNSNYKLPANASKDWTIKPAGEITITLPTDALTYNGEAQTPAPVVKVGDKTLVEGTDYTVEYKDNVNAGEATVTIKPVDGGNYSFDATDKKFDIEPKAITLAWGETEFKYDGTEKEVTATVEGVVEGDDVTVTTYTNNKKTEAGEYKATATELSNSNYKLPANASKDWKINPLKNFNIVIVDGNDTLKVIEVKEGDIITEEVIDLTPEKEGYNFAGWDPELPFKVVDKDETIAVTFVPKTYTVESIDLIGSGFCPESENIIRYTTSGDGAPIEYSITFDEAAIEAGFENVEFTRITEPGELMLYIPYCDAGTYKAQVQFRNIDNSVSKKFDIVMNVNLSTRYMVDIWTDVVSAVNVENRFLEYQWYHNDEKLEGATMPYYCERDGLTGYYFMEVLTVDNRRLRTCPKFFGDTKENISLMVYPNPTSDYAVVELSFDNGEEHKLTVVNELGVLMFETTFTGVKRDINMSSYPTGAYVVNVDGLTVKEIKR